MTYYPWGFVAVWVAAVLLQSWVFYTAGREDRELPALARSGVCALKRTGAVLIGVLASVQAGAGLLFHGTVLSLVMGWGVILMMLTVWVLRNRSIKKVKRLNGVQ